jgi:protein ImuA
MATDNATLSHLRHRIAALESNGGNNGVGAGHNVISFGLAAIDAHLPAGGLTGGCVHEITGGSGSATAFAAALVGRAQRLHRPPVIWIAPRVGQRESLYGPGLAAFGLDPAALIVVRIPGHSHTGTAQALWAMEEALRTPTVGAVCAEINAIGLTASRRLQLAAKAGGTFGLLLRGTFNSAGDAIAPNASVSRWQITSAPSAPALPTSLPGTTRWQVELRRVRGGKPHHWLLEWHHDPNCDTAGGFALAAAPSNRPAVPAAAGDPPEKTAALAG